MDDQPKNDPCVSNDDLELIEKVYERPCPRVVLRAENLPLVDILSLSVHPRFEPYLMLQWNESTREMPEHERSRLLRRLFAVMASKEYGSLAPPPRNLLGL